MAKKKPNPFAKGGKDEEEKDAKGKKGKKPYKFPPKK